MELNVKTLVISMVVLVGLGYGVGRYLQPSEIKTEVKEVVKEVEVVKKDVVTIIKEHKNTDGSTTTETVITDKTTVDKERDEIRERITEIINTKPQYRVRAEAGYDFRNVEPQFAVGAEKRFWGPLSLGLVGTVNQVGSFKSANVTASWEF